MLSRTKKHPTDYIRPRNTRMASAEPRLEVPKTPRRAAALHASQVVAASFISISGFAAGQPLIIHFGRP